MIGEAGDADNRDILNLLGKATLLKLPLKAKLKATETEFRGIWLFKTGEVFRVEVSKSDDKWTAEILQITEKQLAVGSGGAYALGAMLAGKNAVEAVKIACRLDNNSGLPVESISFES